MAESTAKKAAAAAATKNDEKPKADPKPKAEDAPAKKETAAAAAAKERQRRIKAGMCVVPDSDRTPHVGGAVNGLVCSAHAMCYDSQGNLRGAA